MKLNLMFGGFPNGRGDGGNRPRTIRVVFTSDGIETICRIEFAGLISGWNPVSTGHALLGSGDRFDFNAGCRIAFERAWRRLDWSAYAPEFVKQLRRAVQIELGIAKLDAKGRDLDRKLHRCADEYVALLALRANGYEKREEPKIGPEVLATMMRNVLRRVRENREAMTDVSQHHGSPSAKADEPISKPDAYKSVRSTETGKADFPVRTYPMFDREQGHGCGPIPGIGSLPCFHILVGVTDDIVPPECAECAGEPECCTKHGGVI